MTCTLDPQDIRRCPCQGYGGCRGGHCAARIYCRLVGADAAERMTATKGEAVGEGVRGRSPGEGLDVRVDFPAGRQDSSLIHLRVIFKSEIRYRRGTADREWSRPRNKGGSNLPWQRKSSGRVGIRKSRGITRQTGVVEFVRIGY